MLSWQMDGQTVDVRRGSGIHNSGAGGRRYVGFSERPQDWLAVMVSTREPIDPSTAGAVSGANPWRSLSEEEVREFFASFRRR
jgi:hypothetical protein